MHNPFHRLKSTSLVCTLFLLASFFLAPTSWAFSPHEVLRNKDLFYLPISFSSAERIQDFLEYHGSVLADYSVRVTFHHDENPGACDNNDYWYLKGYSDCRGVRDDTDIMIDPNLFPGKPRRLVPYYAMPPLYGANLRVSDLIWELSRGDLNNGCSFGSDGACIDNTVNPVNPAFILAIIQKESGLVYGAGAQPGSYVNNQSVAFRMERATGYTCFENPERSKSCWDENPDWKYYKGFFQQVYYSTRWFRIWTERCDLGPAYGHLGKFYTGAKVNIDGQTVHLKNGITCAMYIYTPHISPNTTNILNYIDGDKNFVEETGRDPGFEPKNVDFL